MFERQKWPILKEYDQQHLARIALPLGGTGTGTVSLGGRGDLRDWEIVNRPAKGYVPASPPGVIGVSSFFAIHAQDGQGRSFTRALEGPLEIEDYEGASGSTVPNHGLPRFRRCSFAAAYPLGQVLLADDDVPVEIRLEAFNPLIPADADASGHPVAVLRFVLHNRSEETLQTSVCGSIVNFIGADGSAGEPGRNRNRFREGTAVQGIFMDSEGVASEDERWGTMALTAERRAAVSYRTAWRSRDWGSGMLDFWDDFSADGLLTERDAEGTDAPIASLAVRQEIPAGETAEALFLLTWHFPNRMTWNPPQPNAEESCCDDGAPERIGNYYTTRYKDAWEVGEQVMVALPELEETTVRFVRSFCDSDLPSVVKEAALFNLAHLRTQTCFRTEDGRFFGFEGCHDQAGCCHGSCTHVWNYEQATAFLFGDLAASMRDTEFRYATGDDGLMSFRVNLPLARGQDYGLAAADGQMGCLMKLYRDWQLSGDDAMLKALWPKARRALEFCWIDGGWDADQDGVMEGCQHNTMDVEYYGPNPQMGAWYLGALRAVEEMARYQGEQAFAKRCRELFEQGGQWLDAHLFNDEYYQHEIRPPQVPPAAGLARGRGATNLEEPELQLGSGCLVDQLVGQLMAHVCGLGYLLDREHVKTTLRSIVKYNFRQGFDDHFNNMRSYVLGDESALLMASYPRGNRPQQPFPYFSEVMTGFEYTAAVHMLYEGQTAAGLDCIQAIRDRYDGQRRSPFDEAECGHHYARAMASWAAVLALTGFHYSAVERAMRFAGQEGTWFWSTGRAWGQCTQQAYEDGVRVTLYVGHGSVELQRIVLTGIGEIEDPAPVRLGPGQQKTWEIKSKT